MSRLNEISIYPFSRLEALLEGIKPPSSLPPIGAHVGDPMGSPPEWVSRIIAEKPDLWGTYPPLRGTEELRNAVASWLTRRYDLPENTLTGTKNVLVVSGTREAIFQTALYGVMRKDGMSRRPVVLVPSPMYLVYFGAATVAGAEVWPVPATASTRFWPDYESVPEDVWSRVALVYSCSPMNPTGTIATLDQLTFLLSKVREVDAILACDECYSEIYRNTPPPGGLEAAMALGGSLENLLVVNSLSKRSSAPGLRSGFIAGSAKTIEEFALLRGFGGAQMAGPLQAASAALWNDEEHVATIRDSYRRRLDMADHFFRGSNDYHSPDAGMFLWLHMGEAEETTQRLWRNQAVRVLPGSYMSRPDLVTGEDPGAEYVRVALVHPETVVEDMLGRIAGEAGLTQD